MNAISFFLITFESFYIADKIVNKISVGRSGKEYLFCYYGCSSFHDFKYSCLAFGIWVAMAVAIFFLTHALDIFSF
jgi:hypothetical protein